MHQHAHKRDNNRRQGTDLAMHGSEPDRVVDEVQEGPQQEVVVERHALQMKESNHSIRSLQCSRRAALTEVLELKLLTMAEVTHNLHTNRDQDVRQLFDGEKRYRTLVSVLVNPWRMMMCTHSSMPL